MAFGYDVREEAKPILSRAFAPRFGGACRRHPVAVWILVVVIRFQRFTSDEEEAEQGARANDHGCHASCSEQHESRQPRSWLILNVRQRDEREFVGFDA